MDVPLQITLRGIRHSEALEHAIREKAAKLQHADDRIQRLRVLVERSLQHADGRGFVVHLSIRVAGGEVTVAREEDDLDVALHEAFRAVRRKLDDQVAHPG